MKWSKPENDLLKDLLDNDRCESWKEVASFFPGRRLESIKIKAYNGGLKLKKINSRRFTMADYVEIRQRRKKGDSWFRIGVDLKFENRKSMIQQFYYMKKKLEDISNNTYTTRICLKCEKQFESINDFRLCNNCNLENRRINDFYANHII